jgi:carbonic anhydrase
VPANEIMGEDAGSVFVARNVANMVVGTDFNLMAALQYAVNVLQVPHIIVCGHYDCGGVRASMQTRDHGPPLENWLRNIRDV